MCYFANIDLSYIQKIDEDDDDDEEEEETTGVDAESGEAQTKK